MLFAADRQLSDAEIRLFAGNVRWQMVVGKAA
jgi:hypothetical protein